MLDKNTQQIVDFVIKVGESSSKEIFEGVDISVSYATLKRTLARLILENYLSSKGRGKGTKYLVSATFEVIQPIDMDELQNRN